MYNFKEELEKYNLTPKIYEAICKDIDNKINGDLDLDWSEIVAKYDLQIAPDTLRKASSSALFGGAFRTAYLKKQLYANPTGFSMTNELDEKITALRKERIKLQTANIERGRVDRHISRQEMYFEYVGKIISTLPLPKFNPIIENDDNDITYCLTLSDVHYGASFISNNNEYSPKIAKERFEYLIGKVIDFIQKKKVQKLICVSLGDMLQGILRISDLKLNDSSVVKATVEISRIMAQFLTELSKYTYIEYYHVPTANHTQTRPLATKCSEIADEDLEYVIGNYIKDLCQNNKRISVYLAENGKEYVEVNIPGLDVVAMHGHQIKNIENSIRDLSIMRKSFIDILLLGHFHSGKEIPSYEGNCSDAEILISPSFIGSDPFSDKLMRGSKASVKIYGFDGIYGHTETYKIILN